MKFDPLNWNEVKPNEDHKAKKGWLRLRVSQAAALYVAVEGYEALVGVETAFNVEVSEAVTYRVEAPKGARVFVFAPPPTTHEPQGEVFTNIDRMVDESGSYNVVTRALREFELQKRAMLREMKLDHDRVLAAMRRPEPEADAEPVVEAVEADAT